MKKVFIILILFFTINICYSEEIIITGNAYKSPKIWLEDGVPKGILVDILNHIGKEMGVDFKIELYNWKRTYYLASNGKSGIVGISQNSERLKIFDYSDPLYYDKVVLVVKKGKEFEFNSFEDLEGKKIGLVGGASYGYEYEEAKKYFIVVGDQDSTHRLKNLILGRIDAALFSPGKASLNLALKQNSQYTRDQFSIIDKPLTFDPNYLAFAKSDNKLDFIKKFNEALKKAQESGEIEKIVSKY